jgi:predicted DNA-binding transcriptional regulator AlpA
MNDGLMTAKEVAKVLRMSESWVRNHVTRGCKPTLPAIKIGEGPRARLRFRPSDIENFIEELKLRWVA